MDPAEFERALFGMMPRAVIEADPTKPRSIRFDCSDCGKQRRGGDRYRCWVCGCFVCVWCADRHELQHPKEARHQAGNKK